MKTILTGSIAIDYLMHFPGYFKDCIIPDHLDKISLSFLVHEMQRHDGGVGPNIGYSLAMLGGNAYLFSTAGQDFPAYAERLQKVGVDTSGVKIIEDKFTASFFATTDRASAQIATFYTGAMADSANLSLEDVDFASDDFVMISPTDIHAMERLISEARSLGLRMLFDPGQQVISLSNESLVEGIRSAWGLFVNEYEFELLQSHTQFSAAEILSFPEFSVVTLGERGALIHTKNEEIFVPAVENLVVQDPTGVGDAFRGGFLRGLMAGLDLKLCGEMGTIAAAYCIVNGGPQDHKFTWEEFKSSYRRVFDDHGELEKLN